MLRACSNCRKILASSASVCPDDGSAGLSLDLAEIPAALAERFSSREAFVVGPTGTSFRITGGGQPDRLLKVISGAVVASPAETARLRRDLQRQTEMNVPSLGRVLEYGIEQSELWLLREFAPGQSLAARMRRPECRAGMPLPAALAIAAQLSAALDELHRAGLLQRDLKASHVIVQTEDEWPRVRLIDAGISAQPALVAPEVAAGQPASFRSDLYALGCVLHQTLSGSLPDGRDFDLDWPRPLAALLASLLAPDPNLRPASAQQVRRTLGGLLPSEAPAIVRGSWQAPQAAHGQLGDQRQAAAPKFRAGVVTMSDKTQEISLGEIEAADPQDPPTQELSTVDIESAATSAYDPLAVPVAKPAARDLAAGSVASPPTAAAIRERLATKIHTSPPPPPPEWLLPPAQRTGDALRAATGATLRPAAPVSRPESARPAKTSSRPAPPPAAYAHRTSPPPRPSGAPGVPARPGPAIPPARPTATAPNADAKVASPSVRVPAQPAQPDFTKTLAGTGSVGRGVAPSASTRAAADGNGSANKALPIATGVGATAPQPSELDALRDAAARGGSTQREILQPSAADVPASRRPGPQMPARNATELGMPAVKPPVQPSSDGDGAVTAAFAALAAGAIPGAPAPKPSADTAGAALGESSRAAKASRDALHDTAPGTLSAVRKAEGTATSPPASVDLKSAVASTQVAAAAALRAEGTPALAAVSGSDSTLAKPASASGPHEPEERDISSDETKPKKPAVSAPAEPRTPPAGLAVSAPIAAASPGAAFDVEALFDDKLEPERAVITQPDDSTDPKLKLDRDKTVEVTPSSKPVRAARSRGLQSWPLLAAAAGLALVALSLSFRACGSSDQHVASSGAPAHVLQPSVAPSAAPAAPGVAPPSAAPAEPLAEVNEPEAPAAPAATAAADKPEADKAPADSQPQTELAGGKTLTAQQAKPLPQSLRGGVVPYRANDDPQIDFKAKGRELYSAGKFKDAAEAYQHAAQKTPSDAGAFAGLGASWLAANQPEKAIPAYQRALQLKPEVSGFQAALGRAYLQKGDRGRAEAAYRKALELDPNNAAAKSGLASAQ